MRHILLLYGTDVITGAAIDHTATAHVSTLVNARLVDASILTGASDDHFGNTLYILDLLNPFSR